MDALEAGGSDTHKLFLEQGDLDDQKAKEVAEYIDAKNKEVIFRELKNNNIILFSNFFSDFSSVQSMLDKQAFGMVLNMVAAGHEKRALSPWAKRQGREQRDSFIHESLYSLSEC